MGRRLKYPANFENSGLHGPCPHVSTGINKAAAFVDTVDHTTLHDCVVQIVPDAVFGRAEPSNGWSAIPARHPKQCV